MNSSHFQSTTAARYFAMSAWLQAKLASLRSSPEWASLSRTMFHGAVTVSIVGFLNWTARRAPALELLFWAWMHAVLLVWAIYEGVRGGWTLRAIVEALSRTVLMTMFTITIYDVYNRDGARCKFPVHLKSLSSAKSVVIERGRLDRNQALSAGRNDDRRKN